MTLPTREDIYFKLPSNVPGVQGNIPSQYTTILPTPLQLNGLLEVALLETHYRNDMRKMLSTRIAVVEITHAPGSDAAATTQIVDELLKLILKRGKESESKSKPATEAEMQSDDPGIAAPRARKDSESKGDPTPQDDMQSDPPPLPHGRERILLVISKDFVPALPAHPAKMRSLTYDAAAARFSGPQGGAPTAQDGSSYITEAMMEVQKKGGSSVKYLGTTDTTLEDNEAKHVEMVKLLPAHAGLEAIALKICMAASET